MTATADCYVYYRVDPVRVEEARRALEAMLVALHATTGLTGRMFSKALDPLLWMEVYSDVADADAFVGVLTRLAQMHGLTACLADSQRRHVELFAPLAPLAPLAP